MLYSVCMYNCNVGIEQAVNSLIYSKVRSLQGYSHSLYEPGSSLKEKLNKSRIIK